MKLADNLVTSARNHGDRHRVHQLCLGVAVQIQKPQQRRNPVVTLLSDPGLPPLLATPLLHEQFMTRFVAEAAALRHAIFVPLGPKVGDAVEFAAGKAGLDRNQVLAGVPHPSGANAERIAFFLGRKARQALSPQVRPERLIAVSTELKAKIAMLAAEHVERAHQA